MTTATTQTAAEYHRIRANGGNIVTNGEWRVSSRTGTGIAGALLNVYRVISLIRGDKIVQVHEYEVKGMVFESCDAAHAWAFEQGYTRQYQPKR